MQFCEMTVLKSEEPRYTGADDNTSQGGGRRKGHIGMGEKATRPKLLLVEDDRATYTALRGILTLRGWDVVVATTVAEALDAAAVPDLDAVILDLMLPDGQGETVLKTLRQREHGARLPIAVTTGVSDAQRIADVERLGATALLRKPIALAELLKAIS
jgi:DNA-binding response OmpR family regulator